LQSQVMMVLSFDGHDESLSNTDVDSLWFIDNTPEDISDDENSERERMILRWRRSSSLGLLFLLKYLSLH
jgi:hypothetical protein